MNKKTKTVEINLYEFSKDELASLILYANERNITFNELVVELLTDYMSKQKEEDKNQLQLF
jgi:hypothetical protein